MNDKPEEKELRVWKIEGEACKEIMQMTKDSEEAAKFLYKSFVEAKKRLDDHLKSTNKDVWKRVLEEINVEDSDAPMKIDVSTESLGFLIIREQERSPIGHRLLTLLGIE